MNRRGAGRRLTAALAAATLALTLAGCSGAEEEGPTYSPATLGEADAEGVADVTFTADAARRVALQTAPVIARGRLLAVPYAALIYDGKGQSWVYTAPQPLAYRRAKVVVRQVSGDSAVLSVGPPAGTRVVTIGATEVYGAELEIASKH